MKELPKGVLMMISRINSETLNIAISSEGISIEPELWGSLLGDVFKNVVHGYASAYDMEENGLIQKMMQAFVSELQTEDEVTADEPTMVMPLDAGDDN